MNQSENLLFLRLLSAPLLNLRCIKRGVAQLVACYVRDVEAAGSSPVTPTKDKRMSHFVYILQSFRDQRYYIGSTSDLEKRLLYHNSGRQRSTRSRIPFKLIYNESFFTKSEALKRERYIKSLKGGEAFKRLISQKK